MTFLWLNFCFHDTAPICISAVALGTPPLTHVFPCPWSRSQAHVSPGPRLASLLGKPVRLWLSGGNGLELFRAHSQLAYKVSTQRNRLVHSRCGRSRGHESSREISLVPSPMVFFAGGPTWPFWSAPPASSKTKWEGKRYSTEYLRWARLTVDLQVWRY